MPEREVEALHYADHAGTLLKRDQTTCKCKLHTHMNIQHVKEHWLRNAVALLRKRQLQGKALPATGV